MWLGVPLSIRIVDWDLLRRAIGMPIERHLCKRVCTWIVDYVCLEVEIHEVEGERTGYWFFTLLVVLLYYGTENSSYFLVLEGYDTQHQILLKYLAEVLRTQLLQILPIFYK